MNRAPEKLETIQKRNNLNEVYRSADPGPGGACHFYVVCRADNKEGVGTVLFQRGPRSEDSSINGMLDGDLLEIVRDRLRAFQAGEFACWENALALRHVEEALLWMARRADERAERGVLGTYQK
jgi:hypothetical protein